MTDKIKQQLHEEIERVASRVGGEILSVNHVHDYCFSLEVKYSFVKNPVWYRVSVQKSGMATLDAPEQLTEMDL